jgi:hypothetical protein
MRRRDGFAEMDQDVAHGRGIGDEGDDAHLGATHGAHQREHFVDAGEHQRPRVAGGTNVYSTRA